MNYHKSAQLFEEYMKKEGFTDGRFELEDKCIDYIESVIIKSQRVLQSVGFYENFVFIDFYFINISEVDVQKRYEILEIINTYNCEKKWVCQVTIDSENDINLADCIDVARIDELNPKYLFDKLTELEEYTEELIPQIMKVMWS